MTIVSESKGDYCEYDRRRRRREVYHRNKRWAWLDNVWGKVKKTPSIVWGGVKKTGSSAFRGIVKVVDGVASTGAAIVGVETTNSPLMCLIDGEQRKTQVNTQYMRNPDIVYGSFNNYVDRSLPF